MDCLDEISELNSHSLITEFNKYFSELEKENHQRDNIISKYLEACRDAGLKVAKVKYKRKNGTKVYDSFGNERWHTWDLI